MIKEKKKKIAVVIDSFTGLYLDELEKYDDIYYLPLQIEINDETFQEGIKRPSIDELIKIRDEGNAKTSLPSLGFMQELITKLSSEYENVVFLPIPSTMSGTFNTLNSFTKDFPNTYIVENHFVADTSLDVAKTIIKMSNKENKKISEIITFIRDINVQTIGFVIPYNLKSIINSGRLKGIKKHIITSGNFSLIIKVYNKLIVSGIARSQKSAIKKVFDKIEKFCNDKNMKEYSFKIVYGHEETLLKIAKEYMKDNLIQITSEMKSSLSTFIHTGYGSIYIGITPTIK